MQTLLCRANYEKNYTRTTAQAEMLRAWPTVPSFLLAAKDSLELRDTEGEKEQTWEGAMHQKG